MCRVSQLPDDSQEVSLPKKRRVFEERVRVQSVQQGGKQKKYNEKEVKELASSMSVGKIRVPCDARVKFLDSGDMDAGLNTVAESQ